MSRLRGRAALVAAVAVLSAACGPSGGLIDAGVAPTRRPAATAPATSGPRATPDPAATPGGDAPAEGDGGRGAPGGPPVEEQPTNSGAAAPTTTVTVYFTRGERVAPVQREVARVPRIGAAALETLLAGPTPGESGAGYGSEIPDGTRLRGLTITDGVAEVDLSREFESGGGALAVTLRVAQVVCTLDAFPTVRGVRFAIDGRMVDVISGEGLVVDEPVACDDYTGARAGDAPS